MQAQQQKHEVTGKIVHVHEGEILLKHHSDNFDSIRESLLFINQKLDTVMATLAELQTAVSDLQTSVDTKQDAIAAAIKALEDQIATGGTITEAQLQPIVDSLRATQADVDSTPTA